VPQGDYFLSADHDEGFGDTVIVQVSAMGIGKRTISLHWPEERPMRVRRVSGSLHGPDFYPTQKQAMISLKLVGGVSGKPIAEATTDAEGSFRFDEDISPGLYFLDVDASQVLTDTDGPMKGLIALDVQPDAPSAEVNLDLD
jgi:hypothetical protein